MNSSKTLDVFVCARNSAHELHNLFDGLQSCEDAGYTLRLFFYENDSTDSTKHLIAEFLKTRHGSLASENIGTTHYSHVVNKQRVANIAEARNKCMTLCTNNTSPISLVVDTGVVFNVDVVESLIIALDDPLVVCACAYGVVQETGEYYDTYALRCNDGSKSLPLFLGSTLHVASAFGGLCAIKSAQYHQCTYTVPDDPEDNEHVGLCTQLRNHGEIVVCKKAKCSWKGD